MEKKTGRIYMLRETERNKFLECIQNFLYQHVMGHTESLEG